MHEQEREELQNCAQTSMMHVHSRIKIPALHTEEYTDESMNLAGRTINNNRYESRRRCYGACIYDQTQFGWPSTLAAIHFHIVILCALRVPSALFINQRNFCSSF